MADVKKIVFSENVWGEMKRGWNLVHRRPKKTKGGGEGDMTDATVARGLSFHALCKQALDFMKEEAAGPDWQKVIEAFETGKEAICTALQEAGPQEAESGPVDLTAVGKFLEANQDKGEDVLLQVGAQIKEDAERVKMAGMILGGLTDESLQLLASHAPALDWEAAARGFQSDADDLFYEYADLLEAHKPPYLSPSRINLYCECPWAYALKYVCKKPERTGAPASFGLAVHDALEEILTAGIPDGAQFSPKDTDHDEALDKPWLFAASKRKVRDGASYQRGRRAIRIALSRFQEIDPSTIVGVEREAKFTIEGVPLFMRIDVEQMLDGEMGPYILVRDWKTGMRIPDSEELNGLGKIGLQMGMCALAAEHEYGLGEPVVCVPDFLFHGEMRTTRTIEDMAELVQYLKWIFAEISDDTEYAPTPGSHCGYCSRWDHCDEWRTEARSLPASPSREDAAAVFECAGGRMKPAASVRKAAQSALDRYIEEDGEVQVRGTKYYRRREKRRQIPAGAVLAWAQQFCGLEYEEAAKKFLTGKLGALDAAAREAGDDAVQALSQATEVSHVSKFATARAGR